MNITREHRPEVAALTTARRVYELSDGQTFYSTPKAYEIWQVNPLRLVKRIERKAVLWVTTQF